MIEKRALFNHIKLQNRGLISEWPCGYFPNLSWNFWKGFVRIKDHPRLKTMSAQCCPNCMFSTSCDAVKTDVMRTCGCSYDCMVVSQGFPFSRKSLSFPHPLLLFFFPVCSGHCYYQTIVTPVSLPDSPCSRIPHTVTLVSIPALAEGNKGRGFSVAIDQPLSPTNGFSPENGRTVRVSQWVSVCVKSSACWKGSYPRSVSKLKQYAQKGSYYSSLSRVDADCISPDVKNSIHVGDKILEINGTPIHNVPLDEVFTAVNHVLFTKSLDFYLPVVFPFVSIHKI